jgi:quinolinate synthase
MNSTAEIKALTGRKGGSICTSSNADKVMRWALERAERVVFLPDEHLGRNISLLRLGLSHEDLVVWDPRFADGGLSRGQLERASVILWKGYCSVHQRFRPEHVVEMRRRVPGVRVIVHPECRHEVVLLADEIGSTEQIARAVRESPPGSLWAVGTELNLVSRLAKENPDKGVFFLDRTVCFCSTMNRIDLPHLYRALVSVERGRPVNVIRVPPEIKEWARVALERMLTLA